MFDIRFAFNKWTLGEDFLLKLEFRKRNEFAEFRFAETIPYKDEEIEQANDYVCGTMMTGAPTPERRGFTNI